MATFYSNIGTSQVTGANFPGGTGGLTTQPGGFNDPLNELSTASTVTATYTIVGTEAVNDVVNLVLLGQGSMVSPDSHVSGNGIATTATISVGDTDTVGGTVSADTSRYSGSVAVNANNTTTPIWFTGGTVLNAPTSITDDPTWVTAKFLTMNTPVAGKVLVFRLKVQGNR